jgi:hypothetical protein
MITPGAVVSILRRGDIAYVVVRRDEFHPGRWRCACKAIARGLAPAFEGITAGEGDLVEIVPAPTYSPGAQVKYSGSSVEVIADHGDTVELAIPSQRFRTRAGDHLAVPPSKVTVDKSVLVLEILGEA